jgi:hypothetical protein
LTAEHLFSKIFDVAGHESGEALAFILMNAGVWIKPFFSQLETFPCWWDERNKDHQRNSHSGGAI